MNSTKTIESHKRYLSSIETVQLLQIICRETNSIVMTNWKTDCHLHFLSLECILALLLYSLHHLLCLITKSQPSYTSSTCICPYNPHIPQVLPLFLSDGIVPWDFDSDSLPALPSTSMDPSLGITILFL